MKQKNFSPLIFLSALGAGGISVMPFAFMQYTTKHPAGLVQRAYIDFDALSGSSLMFQYGLEAIMLIFVALHLILTVIHSKGLWQFWRQGKISELAKNPLASPSLMAPFISIVMTMNVVIGPVRYLLPALLFWIGIYVFLLFSVIYLLKQAFIQKFEMSNISFSWLLYSFAIGMLTVTGMGFAALAKSSAIADTAAFMGLVSGSMGIFLLVLITITVFQKFLLGTGLGDKTAFPAVFIVVPNLTLYAISAFRFGHYLERHHGMHLDSYFTFVTAVPFAIETWYLLFGLVLLWEYFRKDYFSDGYYVTKWGLICPLVAYSVLASFTHKTFISSSVFYGLAAAFMGLSVLIFAELFIRYIRYHK